MSNGRGTEENPYVLTPSELAEAIEIAIIANQPLMIWGPPAVGKSKIVFSVCERMGKKVKDIRALTFESVELKGVPCVKDGRTSWPAPDIWPSEPNWVIFFDELPSAKQDVQAACYQPVWDRKIGDFCLPPDCAIIAAGNRASDKAVFNRMPTPLSSRFTHVELKADVKDWSKWAIDANIEIEIIAFIRFMPSMLHNFDPIKNEKVFPAPRTWEHEDRILKTFKKRKAVAGRLNGIFTAMTAGTIGEMAAVSFLNFLEDWQQLPDPNHVLMNPDTSEMPTKLSVIIALTTALAKIVTPTSVDRFFKFAERMMKEVNQGTEIAMVMISDAIRRDKNLTQSKGYIAWTIKHGDLYI